MIDLLIGAIAFASFIIGTLFIRFYFTTRDRFFIYFALSFWIEGGNRLHGAITHNMYDESPVRYIVRLVAYLLIIYAIWTKNRPLRS